MIGRPKISIILPIYNVAPFLPRCIESVIKQTIHNIEIILATDGPDDCNEICEQYRQKDKRIRVISNPGSYGKAINNSIKIANGKYIGIVETDDWCDPTMFEKLYKKAKKNHADISKCGFYFSYKNDIKHNYSEFFPKQKTVCVSENPIVLSQNPSIWCGIYRKKFLIKNKLFFIEDKISFVDAPFYTLTTLKSNKIAIVNEPLYFYYQDNPNQSIKQGKILDGVTVETSIYNDILKNNPSLYYKYREELIYTTAKRMEWNYIRISDENKQLFWKNARKLIKSCDLTNFKFKYFTDENLIFKYLLKYKTDINYKKMLLSKK